MKSVTVKLSVATLAAFTAGACAAMEPIKVPRKTPELADTSTLDAFKDGVYHIYETNQSLFQTGKKQGASYRLKTEFTKDTPKQFSYDATQNWLVVDGALRAASTPTRLRVIKGDKVALEGRHRSESLIVKLDAYDLKGKTINEFLKGSNNRTTKVADQMSDGYRFSAGAVGYVPSFQVVTNKVVVPNKDIITGQKTLDGFIKTFSDKIPNCLRYERRSGSQPYAIRFINRKGATGEIEIFHAKRGSVFCEVDGERVAKGQYKIEKINGTRLMAFTFPERVDSRDVGIKASERRAVNFAFIEIKSPKKQVLPGVVVRRGSDFHDFQYRFNKVAADDIKRAMK